jgi:hypothetical protein
VFDVTVADLAPVGDYAITLELIDVDDPDTVLADETGTIAVNANVATVLWGDPLPKLATQGVVMTLPLQVYAPAVGIGVLTLTVTGPGDDLTTEQVVEVTKAGDVVIYGSTATEMLSMPMPLIGDDLVGTWNAALVAGYAPVTWYVTVAEGALVGNYTFGVTLEGGNTLALPITVSVSAPESHGEKPPGVGDDTTAPVATIIPVGTLTSTATFDLTASEPDVTFECMLTTNGVAGSWEACTPPKAYTGLPPGTYKFSARATDAADNVSLVSVVTWTVTSTDTNPPPASSGSGTSGAAGTAQPGPQASAGQGEPVQAGAPAPATTRTAQTARIRAQASGRYPVGTVIVLARQPVKTSAGETVRWRATTETRKMCTVRTVNGKSTATLVKRGTCRVVGWAPAPSAEYLPFTIQRTYRAYG